MFMDGGRGSLKRAAVFKPSLNTDINKINKFQNYESRFMTGSSKFETTDQVRTLTHGKHGRFLNLIPQKSLS